MPQLTTREIIAILIILIGGEFAIASIWPDQRAWFGALYFLAIIAIGTVWEERRRARWVRKAKEATEDHLRDEP